MKEEERQAAVDALKAQMMPAIDAALESYLGVFRDAMHFVAAAEVARCIEVVKGCKMTDMHPLGPAANAGWNGAIECVLGRLTSWQTYSERESPSESPDT